MDACIKSALSRLEVLAQSLLLDRTQHFVGHREEQMVFLPEVIGVEGGQFAQLLYQGSSSHSTVLRIGCQRLGEFTDQGPSPPVFGGQHTDRAALDRNAPAQQHGE
jgi:hypothetical protein